LDFTCEVYESFSQWLIYASNEIFGFTSGT
jgi:hypothetical protein